MHPTDYRSSAYKSEHWTGNLSGADSSPASVYFSIDFALWSSPTRGCRNGNPLDRKNLTFEIRNTLLLNRLKVNFDTSIFQISVILPFNFDL